MTSWDDKPSHEFWEVEPYGETDLDFALWNGTNEHGTKVCLSNQSDCCETIDFTSPDEIVMLISHLNAAKLWLEEQRS